MNDVGERLSRALSDERAASVRRSPSDTAWSEIARRASRRRSGAPRIALALTTSVVLLVTAIVTLTQRPISDRPQRLIYVSYGFEGAVATKMSIVSKDLASGRERRLVSGMPTCGSGPLIDPTGDRIVYCADDRMWLVDVGSGERMRLRIDNPGMFAWTPRGTLLLAWTGRRTKVLEYQAGRTRPYYQAEAFIYETIVPVTDDVLATFQCRTETCSTGRDLVVVDVRTGHVLLRQRDAYPVARLDSGKALLFMEDGRISPRRRIGVFRLDDKSTRFTNVQGVFFGDSVRNDLIALSGDLYATTRDEANPEPTSRRKYGIFVFDTRTEKIRRLAPEGDGPQWTPDGRVAYSTEGAIRVTDMRGRSEVVVTGEDVRVIAVL